MNPSRQLWLGRGLAALKHLSKRRAVLLALLAITIAIPLSITLISSKEKLKLPFLSQAEVREATVTITPDGFEPAALLVEKGTRVTWINKDGKGHRVASNPHPEHSGLDGLDSKGWLAAGKSYTYTFETAGEYKYHDHLSPTMNGVVVVQK